MLVLGSIRQPALTMKRLPLSSSLGHQTATPAGVVSLLQKQHPSKALPPTSATHCDLHLSLQLQKLPL